jgi:hypothetical protein
MNYSEFPQWITGRTIERVSVEEGSDFERDFIILHISDALSPDLIIDSRSGDHELSSIIGELEWLIGEVTDAYATYTYWMGEFLAHFVVCTAKGEVVFVWKGNVCKDDVEIRTC